MTQFNSNRWSRLWHNAAGAAPPGKAFQELADHYSEPQRYYHNQRHIDDCLAELDRVNAQATDAMAIELAIWYHDAIYDPRAADNEEQSAQLAGERLIQLGANESLTNAVRNLILATKNHDPTVHQDAPLLMDIDLAILGQSPERFWEYEAQIRQEYIWVDEELFAVKRAEILKQFMKCERIFKTDFFFKRLEHQARENLSASIQRLNQS